MGKERGGEGWGYEQRARRRGMRKEEGRTKGGRGEEGNEWTRKPTPKCLLNITHSDSHHRTGVRDDVVGGHKGPLLGVNRPAQPVVPVVRRATGIRFQRAALRVDRVAEQDAGVKVEVVGDEDSECNVAVARGHEHGGELGARRVLAGRVQHRIAVDLKGRHVNAVAGCHRADVVEKGQHHVLPIEEEAHLVVTREISDARRRARVVLARGVELVGGEMPGRGGGRRECGRGESEGEKEEDEGENAHPILAATDEGTLRTPCASPTGFA